MSKTIIALLVMALAGIGRAEAADSGPKLENVWARATIGRSQISVAYATITSPVADRLVAVETPIAEHAELHTHRMNSDGTMEMRPVDAVELKPKQALVLKPNGLYHVMLTGLKQPLKEGERFPMTFVFEHGGRAEAMVKVENARAMTPKPDKATQPGSGS